MVIPIVINQQDLIDQFSITKKEMEDVCDFIVKEITAQFANRWIETANQELHGTRERYVNNIRVVDEGRMKGAVILDYSKDPLIKMLEEGSNAFDLKESFSQSPKKHEKKDGGWYLTIPFSAATPFSLSASVSTVLPSQIYNIVKNKPVSPVTNRSQGITKSELSNVSDIYKIPKVRTTIINIPKSQTFEAYQHKSSIYEGVYKSKDSVTGQASYGSFRRVSDKSDANSWIYPGLDAKNLAEKTFERFETTMQTVLEDSIDSALSYFGFE